MVHLFKNNGYNIVLDVNSSAVHVVDDVVYDVLDEMNRGADKEELEKKLAGNYSADEIREAEEEMRRFPMGTKIVKLLRKIHVYR